MLEDSAASAETVSCSIINSQLVWKNRDNSVALIDSSGQGVAHSAECTLRKVRTSCDRKRMIGAC